MAEELTQHASHSITHLSCIWVKYQSLFSLRGFDQHPRVETDSEWKVFRSPLVLLLSENRAWYGLGSGVYWNSFSDDLGPQQVSWLTWTSGGASPLWFQPQRRVFVSFWKVHWSVSSFETSSCRKIEEKMFWWFYLHILEYAALAMAKTKTRAPQS